MPVTPMKMRQEAFSLRRGSEVHSKDSSARLEDSPDLTGALATCVSRQMVKHHSTQDNVELSVWERQRFGDCVFEDNLDPSFPGFLCGSGDHLGRGVNPINASLRPDLPLRGDGERTSPAPHIQDRFAGLDTREAKSLLTKDWFRAKHCEPNHEIIPSCRMQDDARR